MEDRNQFNRIEKRLAEIKNRWIKTKSWFFETRNYFVVIKFCKT